MFGLVASISTIADATSASNVMHSYVSPIMQTFIGLGTIAAVFFLVTGGISYMTSSGNPE